MLITLNRLTTTIVWIYGNYVDDNQVNRNDGDSWSSPWLHDGYVGHVMRLTNIIMLPINVTMTVVAECLLIFAVIITPLPLSSGTHLFIELFVIIRLRCFCLFVCLFVYLLLFIVFVGLKIWPWHCFL